MPEHPLTKSELLADMERDWTALNVALDRLTETQLTSPTDAQGWTIKDHLMHLVAWEQSVVGLLHGRPRHLALGVDEALYLAGDEDAINAAIQQQTVAVPLSEVLAQLRQTHQQLLAALQPLSDADLRLPYRHYLPDEPADGDGPPAIDVIANNSARHFAEHLPWIEALADSAR
jgi:hypothetical protein